MSSGAGCDFTEVEPGRWTYWLQDYPYGYTEEGQTYGPFRSYVAAEAHLRANHSNPGGSMSNPLPEGQHVHEWRAGHVNKVVGVTVTITVESLGPDPDPQRLMALIGGLPADHPAIEVRPHEVWAEGTRCAGCGKQQA